MADPQNANGEPAPAADGNAASSEHSITLSQIQIFIMVCVAGALGTCVSKILALDADVASYSVFQSFVAGATAAIIMVFYLARTDTRNVIYACCFALLCGMVGPTVLHKAVDDLKSGMKAGKDLQKDAKEATQTVAGAQNTVAGVRAVQDQATKVMESAQKAVAKDAPEAAVESGNEAMGKITDKLKETMSAPSSPEAATEAAKALAQINKTAQQSNLPKVAQKAEEALRSEPVIATLVTQLTSPDDTTRRDAQTRLTDIGQPAVGPLVEELTKRTGMGDEDSRFRSAAANALAKMKQPIALSSDQAAIVVRLLEANDAQTRLSAADFLMNLEDRTTVRYVFTELSKIARDPDARANASAVRDTATILATWARIFKGDMRQQSLQEAKALLALLKPHKAKWKHTIEDLEDLIKKAEAKQG